MELRFRKIGEHREKIKKSRKIIAFSFVKNQFSDKIALKLAGMFV